MLNIRILLKFLSHNSTEPEPLLLYSWSATVSVKKIRDSNVEQEDLYFSLPDSIESVASEPLPAEMKAGEENIPKPTTNDELIENSN